MAKLLFALSVYLLSLVSGIAGKAVYGPATPKASYSLRDVVDIPGAIEVTDSVNGTVGSETTTTYFVSLAVAQVVDFYVGYSTFGFVEIYLQGQQNYWVLYGDTGVNISTPITLGYHCPENAAKYYFNIRGFDDNPSNFTFEIQKRSSNHEANLTHYSGNVQFYDYGNIGFPVTSQCQKMTLNVILSESVADLSLDYLCRTYDGTCDIAGVAPQTVYQSTSNATFHQFVINCTAPGNYYMRFYADYMLYYNVTVYSNYPCPSGCWVGGVCDIDNQICVCNAGFAGSNCSAISPGSAVNYTEIVLATDGSTYNVTKQTLHENSVMLRIDFNVSTSQNIRVKFSIAPNQNAYVYAYYNLQAYALLSNYTGFTQMISSTGVYREVQLCTGSAGPWYILFDVVSYADVLVTVDKVDIAVITTTFDGLVVQTPLAATVPSVFKFQPLSTSIIIRVNETYPLLYGIYLYSECLLFQDSQTGSSTRSLLSDYSYGFGNYQIAARNMITTQQYYLVVMATTGAKFSGSIDTGTIGSCPQCYDYSHGLCSLGNVCRCRTGYSTANCSQVTLPPGFVQLSPNTTTSITLQSGRFYDTVVYVLPPVIPAGYAILMAASANTDAYAYVSTGFPIATTRSSATVTITNGVEQYYINDCVVRQATQLYFAVAPQKQVGGNLSINITLSTQTLPNTGAQVQVQFYTGATPFITHLPDSCAGAYNVVIHGTSGLYNVYIGEGSTQCFSVSGYFLDYAGQYSFSKIIPITNCSNSIDVRLYSSNSGSANITIEPTTPCPRNCNGKGTCKLGGVCECTYPSTGTDCSIYDAVCTVLPDENACKSYGAPSSLAESFSDPSQYCYLQYLSYNVGQQLLDFESDMTDAGIRLSSSCKNEMQQILCDDIKYKCQTQAGSGVKLMLPCNSLTWQQRCTPNFHNYLYYLENVIYDINNLLATGPFICNPNPFNSSTGSTSTSTSSTTSKSTGTTASSTSAKTTTTSSKASSSTSSTTTQSSTASVTTASLALSLFIAALSQL